MLPRGEGRGRERKKEREREREKRGGAKRVTEGWESSDHRRVERRVERACLSVKLEVEGGLILGCLSLPVGLSLSHVISPLRVCDLCEEEIEEESFYSVYTRRPCRQVSGRDDCSSCTSVPTPPPPLCLL
ncbi:hypothetical protein PBY51_013745 [Eleginops maclovinus]|uniref:Uncharacterized protein n=1 Tax=Eleginops maclovinus TaxID=56733 RepID=A0AAN8AS31_ELEMC|nr:hypothetical protein PBY51_013745 [Eleginops maclovinus]